MTTIKLPQLPDRTPIRLAVTVMPDLHQLLNDYAAHYAAVYGREVSVAEMVPAILSSYLESDRAFLSSLKRT
ncbi:DUF2274 domain-containing protein [Novosphingobium resinovorum]|uniref:Transposase n=1 Tax=Novosphingobium resinovorum TaxID=158500 RepID=A0A1D8A2S8_9SPHN|nr:DUF2274 domain-containing protein [Novosphingobium resinovorum]AOR76366.1 transposase [Novosphingobium resinovorum]